MDKIAKFLTYKIVPEEYKNNPEEIEVAAYGMEGLLCNFTTLGVAFLVSLLFHTTKELCLFLLFFVPLRSSYKSFHCKAFHNCLISSNMAVLIATLTIKNCLYFNGLLLICLLLILCNYLLSSERNILLHIIISLISILAGIIYKDYLIAIMISLCINIILLLLKRGENNEKV